MSATLADHPFYGWNGSAWTPGAPQFAPVFPTDRRGVRFATFNVLCDSFPWFVELAIASKKRFPALVAKVEEVNADVLGLNEVTATSLSALLESEHIRNNYVVSHVPSDLGKHHWSVLFARLPVVQGVFVQLPAINSDVGHNRLVFPALLLKVPAPNGGEIPVAVGALHTMAYQTEANKAIREEQIGGMAACLRSLAEHHPENICIMGDLNLHYVNEDAVVEAVGVVDAWAETHFGAGDDQNPGYTFDPTCNPMIRRYIPGETRRMRLDRIFFGKNCALGPADVCQMWATEVLPPCDEKAGRSLLGQLGLVRRTFDVTLSDHFGLYIDVKAGHPFAGSEEVAQKLQANAELPCEPNPFSKVGFAGSLIGHSAWLVGRVVGAR